MAKKKAAWTVMVYLAGDNNLTTECMFALNEMSKVTLGEELNVIAQFDPNDPYLPTHRYELNKRNSNNTLYTDIIDRARYDEVRDEVSFSKESRNANSLAGRRRLARKSTPKLLERLSLTASEVDRIVTDDTDTGSPVTLYNFISFCLENYPAEHYMVVLSGHAGGTERDYLLKDESSAGSLTFNEMKQVFRLIKRDRRGKLIDIIGMDNCLMSMAEICYELRGLAEIVVGCESFSPTSGWPYREILERLHRDFVHPPLPNGKSVMAEAAKAIVEEYVNYYSTYWMAGLSVTQSALNLRKVEKLQREINKLARVMERELRNEWADKTSERTSPRRRRFENSLLLAHWEAQSYNGEQFVDLFDFCDCLENRVQSKAIARQCQEVKKTIQSEFVLSSCYCGATYQYSYGVSMYFPWAQVAPSYWNLDFINDTKGPGWGSFLKTYTRLTRRLPRGMTSGDIDVDRPRSHMSLPDVSNHRMIDDRMIDDRMINDRGPSRVHSMRNPPEVFVPDKCVRDHNGLVDGQKNLGLR